jgi:hypothetical protein
LRPKIKLLYNHAAGCKCGMCRFDPSPEIWGWVKVISSEGERETAVKDVSEAYSVKDRILCSEVSLF